MQERRATKTLLFKAEGLKGGGLLVTFFGKRLPVVPAGAPTERILKRLVAVVDPEAAHG